MKTILITGANKGIGFETAKQLAQLGHRVFLGSRDKKQGQAAIEALKKLGLLTVELVEIDVSNIHSIQQARQTLEAKIDGLDVLINNAGIAGDLPQNISTGSMDNLRKVFDTNFFGAVQTTQQFIPLLKKSARPIILNVSSELGSLTMHSSPDRTPNWVNFDAYACSKAALNAFTLVLSNELKNNNIRVNSVTPGYTATDLNQHKGIKTAEQGAAPIVKWATQGKEEITGKFFKDGGEVPW